MRSYTNDEVIERLDETYARDAIGDATPEKPDDTSYHEGAVPLDTLPAPWWNWFIQNLLKTEARTSDAVADIYTELKAILEEAEIDADGNIHNQLLQGIKKVTISNVADRVTELETDTVALDGRVTALENDNALSDDVTALTSRVTSIETWKDELPARRFAMIGGGTTPTPAIP